ncbi:MAG: hypothetical protein HOZ81_10440 [Streptomyces sp.]|nr:hypothetical protein [Streptomyces sp.]
MTTPETVALPMPVVVTRHQCPHCRRYTRADPKRVQWHMARCWHNPGARGCKTCKHFEPSAPGPYEGDPGWPEECGAEDGPALERPIVHCPFWEPDAHHTTPAPAAG